MTDIDLTTVVLSRGQHDSFEQGACLLEAVAYVNGEPFSDHPDCVSPVLGAFGRSLNDAISGEKRQLLVPFIPRLVGTAGDRAADQIRGLMAMDWLIRIYTPVWLRLAGLEEAAVSLEALPRRATWGDVEAAVPVVRAARAAAAAAAWNTGDAGRDAARTVAWSAWAAAGAAARAAWDAVNAAPGDGGRDAARDTARAAWDAVGNAIAGDAARDAPWDGGRDTAWAAVNHTRDQLQDSAIELFSRMVEVAAR